jgi:hypothetical protein
VTVFSKSATLSLLEGRALSKAVDPFRVLPPSIIVHSLVVLREHPRSRLAGTPIIFPRLHQASGQDTRAPPCPIFWPPPGTGGIALLRLRGVNLSFPWQEPGRYPLFLLPLLSSGSAAPVLVAKPPELLRAAPATHRFSSASPVLLVGFLSRAAVPHRRRRGEGGDMGRGVGLLRR